MKLSNVNQYTIPQMTHEALEDALGRTADKRKIAAIQVELDRRKAAGVDRPMTLEDWL